MTLRELAGSLADAGVDNARSDVLRLAEAASGLPRASLMARFDDEINTYPWFAELLSMTSRRAKREPLQYILGRWEFYGNEYTVTPDVLIPRPETELLVDYAISHLTPSARIADLCCGSGCIGIAVCLNADAHCESVDISDAALRVACENAASLGISEKITFTPGDVLSGTVLAGRFDMILSNPPYVTTDELEMLAPELSFEPRIAFDGGGDGMVFYRRIVEACKDNLAPGGAFVFEIGATQSDGVTALANAHGFSCEVAPDLAGLPRMAVLKRKQADIFHKSIDKIKR